MLLRSPQLSRSGPGRMNASMKRRSNRTPSRLVMNTVSEMPWSGQSGSNLRPGTKRHGNIR